MKAEKTALFIAILAVASCNVATPEKIDFAVSDKFVTVEAEGGDGTVKVFTDAEVTVTPDVTPEWGKMITPSTFSEDSDITVTFSENTGLRRAVNVKVVYKNGLAVDTVLFRQEGLIPELELAIHSLFIDARAAAETEVALSTNINAQDIKSEIEYPGSNENWITGLRLENDKIVISTAANQTDKLKKASIRLSFTDGWGTTVSDNLSVCLSDNSGKFGKMTDFPTVRGLATEQGTTVEDDLILEGIVVSDCSSKNMEMNPNLQYNEVDTTPSDRTGYFESTDGKYGFKLVFNSEEFNTLKQKDRINLYLNECTLTKETDPDRYTISGLSGNNILVVEEDVTLPAKKKKISDLTDDDIHTYVELENTEFLNKEGCFSNVYDQFTLASSFNTTKVSTGMNADCWPAMLIDSEGKPIYAIVNMLCNWRRTGSGVPQGIGLLKGILVHNEQPRYGDMGRYQIRVIDNNGYAQRKSSGSSFSVFAKWDGKPFAYNFSNFGSYFPYVTTSGGMDSRIPSDDLNKSTGVCKAVISFENKMGMPQEGSLAIRPGQTYDHVKMNSDGGVISKRCLSIQCDIAGWYNWKEDGSLDSYNGIVIDFSTLDISGKRLFLYFGFYAGNKGMPAAFKNFPARWCVEYSIDGGLNYSIVNAVETGKPYVHMRCYPFSGPTAIDGRNYYPSYSTGLAQTEHLYEFPSDITGKDNVKVRIRPFDTCITSIPDDPAADIETSKAYKGISLYQDIRFNRINLITK